MGRWKVTPPPGNNSSSIKENVRPVIWFKGRGGFIGPDLTSVGRERRLGQIQRKLRDPSRQITHGFQVVLVRLRDGRTIRGVAKNETNYDLQLQTPDGQLLFLKRSEIASENREQKSLMPPVDASQNEMQNLLAYLSRLSGLKESVSKTDLAYRRERWLTR